MDPSAEAPLVIRKLVHAVKSWMLNITSEAMTPVIESVIIFMIFHISLAVEESAPSTGLYDSSGLVKIHFLDGYLFFQFPPSFKAIMIPEEMLFVNLLGGGVSPVFPVPMQKLTYRR